MRNFIKQALTRTISVRVGRGKTRQVELAPNEKLVYGMYFAIAALIALTTLEATYILVLRSFSTEIFAAISLVIGTILGAFFGHKG
ncbi:MAG: hypothetical protein GTO14_14545 [Anaerolineales bacterium]|nr:hypothetical protein [Anaerolineales bacterium]